MHAVRLGVSLLGKAKISREYVYVSVFESCYQFYNLAVDVIGVVYFYEILGSVWWSILPFAIARLLLGMSAPLLGKLIGLMGTRNSVMMAVGWFVFATVPMYLFVETGQLGWAWGWLACFFLGKAFYLFPNLYYVGKLTSHSQRGTQLALKRYLLIGMALITPAAAGLASEYWGFASVVGMASLILTVGAGLAWRLPNYYFDFSLTWNDVFHGRRSSDIWLASGMMLSTLAGNRLWAMWMFVWLGGSLAKLGGVVTVTLGLALGMNYFVGNFLNTHRRDHSLVWGLRGAGFLQMFRIFQIVLGLPVVIVDFVGRLVNELVAEVFDTYFYDMSTDHILKSRRDEMTAMFEGIAEFSFGMNLLVFAAITELWGFSIGLYGVAVVLFLGAWKLERMMK